MKRKPSPTILLIALFIFTTTSSLLPYIPSAAQVMLSTYIITPLIATSIFYYFVIRKDPKTGIPRVYKKSEQDIVNFKAGLTRTAKIKTLIKGALASVALTLPFLPGIYTYPALLIYLPAKHITLSAEILSTYKPRKIPRATIIAEESSTGRTLKFFWSTSGATSFEERQNVILTVKESWFGTYVLDISKH